MKLKVLILITFLVIISGNTIILAQDLNAIQTVVPFLSIAPDSRSGGMGDVGAATSPDVYSMHWYPAKFAFIDGESRLTTLNPQTLNPPAHFSSL